MDMIGKIMRPFHLIWYISTLEEYGSFIIPNYFNCNDITDIIVENGFTMNVLPLTIFKDNKFNDMALTEDL